MKKLIFSGVILFSLLTLAFAPCVVAIPSHSSGVASISVEGWLDGWNYRKNHTINLSPGAGVNYQIRLYAHYDDGMDSSDNVFLNFSSQTDFGDIRFTEDDGVTLLDYWLEEHASGENATFWVEVKDDLSTSDATIWIYWNTVSTVSTTSSGLDTFIFFEGFDIPEITPPDNETWRLSWLGDGLHLDGEGHLLMEAEAQNERAGIGTHTFFEPYGIAVRSKVFCSINDLGVARLGTLRTNNGDYADWYTQAIPNEIRFNSINNHVMTQTDVVLDTMDTWRSYETVWLNGHTMLFQDDIEYIHHTTNTPDEACCVTFNEGYGPLTEYALVDWVFVRKATLTEPALGGWGELQTLLLEPATTPQTIDFILFIGQSISVVSIVIIISAIYLIRRQ